MKFITIQLSTKKFETTIIKLDKNKLNKKTSLYL